MDTRNFLVSVIGGHDCDGATASLARETGKIVAEEGATLVCGGLGGIMKEACRGAREAGGLTVGIIPGEDKDAANEFVDVVIATGMGYSRNTLVAGTADMVVALPGKYGTLSEIAFALNAKIPVYGLNTWDIEGVKSLRTTEDLRKIIRRDVKERQI